MSRFEPRPGEPPPEHPQSDGTWAEEPWEAEVGALLSRLPASIEPPSGFIARAVNRPPRHGWSILAGLVAASVLAIVLGVALDEQGPIAPAIDELAQAHLSASADRPDPGDPSGAAAGEGLVVQGHAPWLAPVVDGYELVAPAAGTDVPQARYERADATVSIFFLDDPVDWTALPADGHRTVDDVRAWVDADGSLAVVEVGGEAVAVAGADVDEVLAAAMAADTDGGRSAESGDRSFGERVDHLMADIVSHVGFPTGD